MPAYYVLVKKFETDIKEESIRAEKFQVKDGDLYFYLVGNGVPIKIYAKGYWMSVSDRNEDWPL